MTTIRGSTFVAFILLITFFFAINVAAKTAAEIYEKVSPSIVVVQIYDEEGKAIGFGSGVVVPGGDVATNCHVVEKAAMIKVHQGGKDYNAVLHYNDQNRDVCSLSVPGMRVPPIPIGTTKNVKVGSKIYALGAPQGLELSLSEGIISSLRPVEGGQYLQITAPISPGSSGGGLFDEEGRLIGLTAFYLMEGQQLNFAVPVEWIVELPTRHDKASKSAVRSIDWLNKALVLQKKKDWAGLINHAVQWTKMLPGDADAWFALGLGYDNSGQSDKGIKAYQQAVRISPEYAEAWNNLGFAYGKSGQSAKAIEACQEALRINPKNAYTWKNLGFAYGKSGQYDKAIDAYQQAVRISPEYAEAWNNLGVNFGKSGQYDKAISAYQQALRIEPENGGYWFNLGIGYDESAQPAKAIDAYQQALRINPEDASVWYNLGLAYHESRQRGLVMEVYKRLKTLDPAMADKFFSNVVLP